MADMSGKRVVVTGATQGIGRAAALELARLGAGVTIVGRDPRRTGETAEALARESGNPDVEHLVADLSLVSEVSRLASEISARYRRLDVLVNNAGGYFGGARQVTREGYEMTFALNHLAYFALTRDLLPLLKRSGPARVVSVSSGAQGMGAVDFDDLMGEKRYNGQRAYNQSKLANVLFTVELARRLRGSPVTANALHPGLVRTNFGQDYPGVFMKVLTTVVRPFMISPEQGADTAVWLASSPEVEGVTGKYFAARKEQRPNKLALDPAACARLWEISEQLVDRVPWAPALARAG